MQSGIYMIRCNTNGKRYIGNAKNIANRLYNHFRLLERFEHWNYQLQDDWGEFTAAVFELKTLEYCPEEKLIEREQWYFDNWKPEYNLCPKARSRQGYKATRPVIQPPCSEEKKEKLRQKALGRKHSEETKALISQQSTGRYHTEETKERIAQSHIGMKLTESTLQKINEKAKERRLLSNEQIIDIRTSILSRKALAEKYNVSYMTIVKIQKYERYKDVK